jgi:hypothetical protein
VNDVGCIFPILTAERVYDVHKFDALLATHRTTTATIAAVYVSYNPLTTTTKTTNKTLILKEK